MQFSMFGMICFRSESTRIKGCIKTRPSDFQVTEINLSGKDAVLSSPDKHASTSETLHIIPMKQDRNMVKEDQYTSLNSHQDTRNSVPITKDNENTSVLLTEVLEDDIYKSIQDYAETQRARINKSAIPKLDETDRIPPLSLGIFHEKKQRAHVYSAVKRQFPHLHAVVDDDHEMKISVDDMYLTFRSLLSEEDSDNLLRIVSRREVNETLDLDHMPCKSVRTNVHRLIHRHYGSLVESKTFTRDTDGISKSWIQLRIKEKSRGQKRKSDHTKDKIFYTGFTLWKDNLETLDAIQIIARAIKVQPSDISYAGIKDKRAITMQFMAVNQPFHRVSNLLNDLVAAQRGVKVGNLHSRTGPITTGELWGNRFRLIVRNVVLKDVDTTTNCCLSCRESNLKEDLVRRIERLKRDGFINYFGKQRFGELCQTPSGSLTADVGLAMLQKDYKRAVDLILSPDSDKDDPVNKAKRIFQETHDCRAALKVMPHYKVRECAILRALHRHGIEQEGCCKALLGIPHRMRQLYIHSFTSLLWNHMVTQRILDHGFDVIPGDLITTTEAGRVTKTEVKIASTEDLSDKLTYSIKNVVLPLPGNMVKYPENRTGKAYRQLFKTYGLESCQFRLSSLQLNVPGDYRRLMETPLEFQWSLFHEDGNVSRCSEFNEGQSETKDVEDSHETETNAGHCRSRRSSEESLTPREAQRLQDDSNEKKPSAMKDGSLKICKCGIDISEADLNMEISFKLPSSTYATTLLRELIED